MGLDEKEGKGQCSGRDRDLHVLHSLWKSQNPTWSVSALRSTPAACLPACLRGTQPNFLRYFKINGVSVASRRRLNLTEWSRAGPRQPCASQNRDTENWSAVKKGNESGDSCLQWFQCSMHRHAHVHDLSHRLTVQWQSGLRFARRLWTVFGEVGWEAGGGQVKTLFFQTPYMTGTFKGIINQPKWIFHTFWMCCNLWWHVPIRQLFWSSIWWKEVSEPMHGSADEKHINTWHVLWAPSLIMKTGDNVRI